MKKLMRASVLLSFILFAVSSEVCGESKPAEDAPGGSKKTSLTFATNANFQPVVDAMISLMEPKGYTINLKTFDDPISIDVATEEGSIDANLYQHLPYLDNFNRSRGGHLVMLKPYVWAGFMGLYSEKHSSIDRLPDGATIAVAMDASNRDRCLRMLRDNGLLTLAETATAASGMYAPVDIAANPKQLKLIEADLYQLLRSLADVDAGCINGAYLVTAGRDPKSGICFTKDDGQYPAGIVVREDNKDTQWAKDMLEAVTSDKCRKVIEVRFKGAFKVMF